MIKYKLKWYHIVTRDELLKIRKELFDKELEIVIPNYNHPELIQYLKKSDFAIKKER